MGDHRLVIDNLRFEYEGPFQIKELFHVIHTYLYDKGYDKKIVKDFEQNTPDGTFIEWEGHPWKKITDHIRLELRIRILMFNLQKKSMIINNKKTTVFSGKALIIFNGFMESDYDQYWDKKPLFTFYRGILDRFVYAIYYKQYEHIFRDHVNQLYQQIQQFLNVYTNQGAITTPPSPTLAHHHFEDH